MHKVLLGPIVTKEGREQKSEKPSDKCQKPHAQDSVAVVVVTVPLAVRT
jgi:hypothetical protein